MASTCVWFPYPDSAWLVLGCVQVCVLPQRLSKGKMYRLDTGRNGMAAMTNGDKGEEVCNALRQRVATAYGWAGAEAVRRRLLLLIAITDDIEQ
jgi:hypothetical protein